MMMRIGLFASLAGLVAGGGFGPAALAQTASLEALKGHSVLVSHQEKIHRRNGEVVDISWNDRIYISSEGRIFHKEDRRDSRPDRGAQRERVGEADGGGRRRFRWSGDGLSREWINRQGWPIGQSVRFSPTGNGFGCAMTVTRGDGRGSVQVISSTCRVVRGNVFAGQGS